MQQIKSAVFLFIGLLFSFSSGGTTWTTINYGYWNNGSTWSGGVAPPFSGADTFLIQHPVAIDTTITLFPGAVFQIDSTGGICGHEKMIFQSNSMLTIYGLLELDTLHVPGGHVYGYNPGTITLTEAGIVSNGGSMSITCAMAVGPWFNCHQPEYFFLTGLEESIEATEITIYPNPAQTGGMCKIEFEIADAAGITIDILDISGKIVFSSMIPAPVISKTTLDINLRSVAPGIYLVRCSTGSVVYFSKLAVTE